MNDSATVQVRSITDLARIAGVSVSTVSRALTGKGALKEATRDRVRALAEKHGFRLNVAAQNLRLGRTGAIAVLLPLGHERGQHLSDPFFMAMLGFLADALIDRGYDLMLSRILPSSEDWLDSFVNAGRADGVIIIGQSDQGAVLNRMAKSYAPMVIWGAYSPDNAYVTVGVDNVAGGKLAADHLVSQGRKRLAYFGNATVPEFAARYEGFHAALPDDLRRRHELVPTPMTPESSYAAANAYFEKGNRPDGIFAASDIVAMSVMTAAAEHGLKIPTDISVVGFDDVLMARLANPPLTTIKQDIERGVELLTDLLFRRMEGQDVQSVQIAPSLVIRQSS